MIPSIAAAICRGECADASELAAIADHAAKSAIQAAGAMVVSAPSIPSDAHDAQKNVAQTASALHATSGACDRSDWVKSAAIKETISSAKIPPTGEAIAVDAIAPELFASELSVHGTSVAAMPMIASSPLIIDAAEARLANALTIRSFDRHPCTCLASGHAA